MKILLLAPTPYPADGDASLRLDRLLQLFRNQELELQVFCIEGEQDLNTSSQELQSFPGPDRRFWKRALRQAQELQVDLIYCAGLPSPGLKKLSKKLNCPYWLDLSQSRALSTPGRFPFALQQTLTAASGIICGSEAERKLWKERKQKNLFVLEQASVLPEAAPSAHGFRHELRLTESAIFAQVSLDREEELLLLLKAFSRLAPELEASLVLSGGPASDIIRWRHQVQELPRSQHIHFLAPRPLRDLPELYKQADLILFPQLGQERPHLLPSAMAAGKAILCWQSHAIDEMGQGDSLRCSPHSEAEMSRMLQQLLEQEVERQELGQRAFQSYQNMQIEQRSQEQLLALLKAMRASAANHR